MRRRAGARGRAKHEYYETEVSGLYHEIIELGLLGQFRGIAGGLALTASTERREETFFLAEDRLRTVGLRLRY